MKCLLKYSILFFSTYISIQSYGLSSNDIDSELININTTGTTEIDLRSMDDEQKSEYLQKTSDYLLRQAIKNVESLPLSPWFPDAKLLKHMLSLNKNVSFQFTEGKDKVCQPGVTAFVYPNTKVIHFCDSLRSNPLIAVNSTLHELSHLAGISGEKEASALEATIMIVAGATLPINTSYSKQFNHTVRSQSAQELKNKFLDHDVIFQPDLIKAVSFKKQINQFINLDKYKLRIVSYNDLLDGKLFCKIQKDKSDIYGEAFKADFNSGFLNTQFVFDHLAKEEKANSIDYIFQFRNSNYQFLVVCEQFAKLEIYKNSVMKTFENVFKIYQ